MTKNGPVGPYKARAGSQVSKKAVAAFGPVLRKLSAQGKATKEDVVRVASKKNSPIHKYFEWDDKVAAHEHRLEQARNYMRAIVVEIEIEDLGPVQIRVFNPDPDPEEASWSFVFDHFDEDEPLAPLIARAKRELIMFQKKYKNLRRIAEAVPLFKGIDKFLENL